MRVLCFSHFLNSFCFGTLADFKYKMLSASHVDRLLKRPAYKSYLTDASIQNRICSGKDLYDMPPEVFSWGDLIQYWNGAKHTLGNDYLPQAVLTDYERFKYLLPGGCKRPAGNLDKNITPFKLKATRTINEKAVTHS